MSKLIILFTIAALCAYVCSGAQECPVNSELKQCGSICEPTCKDPRERLCKIDASKCTAGCRCVTGFVRNEETKECVKFEDCGSTNTASSDGRSTPRTSAGFVRKIGGRIAKRTIRRTTTASPARSMSPNTDDSTTTASTGDSTTSASTGDSTTFASTGGRSTPRNDVRFTSRIVGTTTTASPSGRPMSTSISDSTTTASTG